MAAAALSSSAATLYSSSSSIFSAKPSKSPDSFPLLTLKFPNKKYNTILSTFGSNFTTNQLFNISSSIYCFSSSSSTRTNSTSAASSPSIFITPNSSSTHGINGCYWIVGVKPPPSQPSISKPQIINYYVKTLAKVLGSEEDAQMCIYNASCDTHFGFCCDIDEDTSRKLSSLPEVLSIRPDLDFNSSKKDYSYLNDQLHLSSSYNGGGSPLFPAGNSKNWLVQVETPALGVISRAQVVDYYAQILTKVLRNEKDAQMCIYHISWQSNYGFCCELDDECALEFTDVPGVLSVQPDQNVESDNKDYRGISLSILFYGGGSPLFPPGNSKHWLVRVETPPLRVITRAQVVDYCAQILTKVLRNEKDAQMCIYHISWQSNYGFCCELDDECAKELADVPGVLSVQPDQNVESDNKDYRGDNLQLSSNGADSSATNQPIIIKTKKLFVTGLSFYTSKKTLRAAFEGFGELVGVKIIKNKISKRSKTFAFIEYTTEEAANAALKEMNGKIINGWILVVNVAKTNPRKYSRGRPRPSI